MNFQTSKKTVNLSKEIWPMVKQYYAWCKEAKQAGKKVVWTVGLGPNELLHAFGWLPSSWNSIPSSWQGDIR